ncbi:hypothetical protein [Paraburkholderia youngii]|uniref:hypothetical protein n=1 Tax=Paraburkholderia youngii TaxID=2782701 RepID=UPI003D20C9B7
MNQKANATTPPRKIHAQHFTFEQFKLHAVITALEGTPRPGRVEFFGQDLGFADALGDDGLRGVHEREVNNALYFNSTDVGHIRTGVPLPAPEALDEYPALRNTFPDAASAVDEGRVMPTAEEIAKVTEAGFRLEFGAPDCGDPELAGRWWWTLGQTGWSGFDVSEGEFDTAAAAWADAVRYLREDPSLLVQAA